MTAATVILAAGQGRRLAGASKPLIRLAGETLAARALHVALTAGTVPVLVLGHRSEEVLKVLQSECPEPLRSSQVVILNATDGTTPVLPPMADSYRAGVQRAAELGVEQIAVLLVDQPGIGAAALSTVLEAHTPGRITRGAVSGRPTHPVVFDAEDALAAAEQACGDQGAREYLRAQAERVDLIDLTGLAQDADLDTAQDLQRLGAER